MALPRAGRGGRALGMRVGNFLLPSHRKGSDSRALRPVVVIQQYALGRAVEIFVLARTERPKEGGQADKPQQYGYGNEDDEIVHWPATAAAGLSTGMRRRSSGWPTRAGRNRMAFATTSTDDSDIATAARSGVTSPLTATGTASAL